MERYQIILRLRGHDERHVIYVLATNESSAISKASVKLINQQFGKDYAHYTAALSTVEVEGVGLAPTITVNESELDRVVVRREDGSTLKLSELLAVPAV